MSRSPRRRGKMRNVVLVRDRVWPPRRNFNLVERFPDLTLVSG